MTDIQAAMGLVELERYDSDMLVRRREIFDHYTTAFSKYSWAQVPEYENQEKRSSYHVYLLRIRDIDEATRDRIMQSIFSRGVAVNVHFIPLPLLNHYRMSGHCIAEYPVSHDSFKREISLPVYYDLDDDKVKRVIDAVVKSVEENLR
jgi:dTDP-4-amino-4,6-dideoxygalactose transaminase